MDLHSLIQANTHVVEVFLCPESVKSDDPHAHVHVGWEKPFAIQGLGNGHATKLHEYYHRDLCYSYDMGNDAQRVVRRVEQNEQHHGNWYGTAYTEDVLPSHMFPSTKEIVKEGCIDRISYRINNRMFIYHDHEPGNDYYYVRYQHAPNVDLQKMQADLDKAMRMLHRSCRGTQNPRRL